MQRDSRVLLIALLLDLLLGDPPNRWHPVAWMGTLIMRLRKSAPAQGKFLYGGLITVGGSAFVWVLSKVAVQLSRKLPTPLDLVAQGWLLKSTLSLRGLNHAGLDVETELRTGDLLEARRRLSWHLVSRNTTRLSSAQVAGAAVSSVAENTSDGIIAPLFWYAIGGVPAALVYRFVNTGDSILGYRDVEREWLGKIPARMDDLLNLIPARVTALLFIMLRPRAWAIWRRDARLTDSPNAGHPMSAMAGALDVELEKVDHYLLNAGAPAPTVNDLRQSRRLMFGAVGMFTLILLIMTHSIIRN